MVNPIDYTLDVANPFQAAMQGFQTGQQIVSNQEVIQAQRAAEERKQVELLQKQKQQEDLYNFSLIPNKTYEDFVGISNKYPSMSEDFKRNWEIQNEGQQQDSLRISSQAYAALRSNQPQVAKDILDDQITAYENSGYKKEAFNLKRLKVMIDQNPQGAETSIGMMMSSVNPNKFKDILGTIGQESRADQIQPYEIDEIQSKTANNYSQVSDRQEGRRIQEREVELKDNQFYAGLEQGQQQFYDKLDHEDKIAARKLAANKVETSVQKVERLEKAQSFATAAINGSGTAKLAAELINDYKKLSDASGAGVWNAAMRNIPGTAEYDFARRIETLKSQAFLIGAQNLRGLGAMTEMEGKKVTDALGNLDLSQNTQQVAMQLADIAKAANNVAQSANKNAQIYATKGQGYSQAVIDAAKELGITPAEAQRFVNQNGL